METICLGGVGMLASKTIEAFHAMRIGLLKKIGIEITFMIFGEEIENVTRKQRVLMKFNRAGFERDWHGPAQVAILPVIIL